MANSDDRRATNLKDAYRACDRRVLTADATINVYLYDSDKLDLEYNIDGLNEVTQLMAQQVDIDAIFDDSELFLEMVKASGGYVRHLMQMMQTACIQALGMGRVQIQRDNVIYAVNQYQFQFERSIPYSSYPELVRVAQQKSLTDVHIDPDLLLSQAILEYTNGDGGHHWVYPHPVIKRIRAFNQFV